MSHDTLHGLSPWQRAMPKLPHRLLARGWWLPPLLAGAALRLWHLPAQIVGGDELNGVEAALSQPLAKVLTTYQLSDPCLPLAGLDRLVYLARGTLTETAVRLPVVLCGLAALLVAPWVVGRRLGRGVGLLFAWLFALSPLLVLYSRIARPYLPIVLFGFGATAAFEAWWRTRRPRYAAAYVLLGALAIWFHLGSAPLVAAPFAFALGSLVFDRARRDRPGLGALVLLGAALALACVAFLAPAWGSLQALVAAKHGALEVRPATVAGVLLLQAGTPHPALAVAFWTLAALGLGALLYRERALGLYTLALAAAQVAGLLVLAPEMLVHPLVFDRYLLPVLPWVLVWVAAGLAAAGSWARRRLAAGWAVWAPRAAAAAFLATLFLAGPFADPAVRASPFLGHNDYVAFFCHRARLPLAAVPAFYRDVLRRQRHAPVLEYPWLTWWAHTRAYYVYQELHGQDVLLAPVVQQLPDAAKLSFRNMPPPDPAAFLASRARYLAVHEDPVAEEEQVIPHCWPLVAELGPGQRWTLRHAARAMERELTATWGEPDYREPGLAVWDLERVRRAFTAAAAGW
jgi:hypothetical protein